MQRFNKAVPKSQLRKMVSPTYFTGKPILHDTLYAIEHAIENTETPVVPQDRKVSFLGFDDLQAKWNVTLTRDEYNNLVDRLDDLAQRDPDNEVVQDLVQAQKEDASYQQQGTDLDQWGRVYATGTRKKLMAHVWVSKAPNDNGTVLIDGAPYQSMLASMRDRFIVSSVFHPSIMGQFNVWCELKSAFEDKNLLYDKQIIAKQFSGCTDTMGRSNIRDALVTAMARGLKQYLTVTVDILAQDEEYMKLLQEYSQADTRQREPKTSGQPSARAKHQWVRR